MLKSFPLSTSTPLFKGGVSTGSKFFLLFVALICTFYVSLVAGPAHISSGKILKLLLTLPQSRTSADWYIFADIRLPRVLLASLVGGALGCSGAVLQGLLRNPLADPGLIGVSSGAALAASLVIVLSSSFFPAYASSFSLWSIPAAGLLGGLGAVLILYLFATKKGSTSIATIILGGVSISAFAGALTGIIVTAANDQTLRTITFWSLGSLAGASWPELEAFLPFLVAGGVCIISLPHGLNALQLGEAEAHHMGASVQKIKRLCLFSAACLTGAAVSVSGIIGFIGLLVPHLARLGFSPDYRIVLPASALLGATLLLLADTLARLLIAPAELPVGIVTATIGAPCFFWLLLKKQGSPL